MLLVPQRHALFKAGRACSDLLAQTPTPQPSCLQSLLGVLSTLSSPSSCSPAVAADQSTSPSCVLIQCFFLLKESCDLHLAQHAIGFILLGLLSLLSICSCKHCSCSWTMLCWLQILLLQISQQDSNVFSVLVVSLCMLPAQCCSCLMVSQVAV